MLFYEAARNYGVGVGGRHWEGVVSGLSVMLAVKGHEVSNSNSHQSNCPLDHLQGFVHLTLSKYWGTG